MLLNFKDGQKLKACFFGCKYMVWRAMILWDLRRKFDICPRLVGHLHYQESHHIAGNFNPKWVDVMYFNIRKNIPTNGGTNTIQLSKDSALLSRNRRTSMWWVLSVEVWIPQWLPSGALSPRSPRFSTGHVVTPWLQNWWRRFMWMKHVSKDSMQWLVEVHTTYFDVLWLCLYKV